MQMNLGVHARAVITTREESTAVDGGFLFPRAFCTNIVLVKKQKKRQSARRHARIASYKNPPRRQKQSIRPHGRKNLSTQAAPPSGASRCGHARLTQPAIQADCGVNVAERSGTSRASWIDGPFLVTSSRRH